MDGKQGFAIKDSRELQELVIVLGMFHFKGWMKDVRISSSARYTKDFTPPTEMKPDPGTLGLYRCDEGDGKVLKDSSGNDRHGEIIGAKWIEGKADSPDYKDRPWIVRTWIGLGRILLRQGYHGTVSTVITSATILETTPPLSVGRAHFSALNPGLLPHGF